MRVGSSAFGDGDAIPVRFAMRGVPGGLNISIPVSWSDVPPDTLSFAVSLVDPHPVARDWVHWLVINLPPELLSLDEGMSGPRLPSPAKELQNSYGVTGYGGPQPPAGSGVHPYVCTVYALRTPRLDLPLRTSLSMFLATVGESLIESASVTGTFVRS